MAKIYGSTSYNAPVANEELVQKQYADTAGAGGIFVGTTIQYAGASAPSGWLICDGSAVSRTTYSALFAAIGTLHGAGDGSTTFNLPDLRRRALVGKGTSDTIGQNDGLAEGSRGLTHSHSIPAHYHAMGSGSDLNVTSSGGSTTGSSATGISINSTNTDHTHGLAGSGAGTSTDGSHNHSISDPSHSHGQNTTANPGSGNGSLWAAGIRSDYWGDGSNENYYPMNINTGGIWYAFGVASIIGAGSHSHSLTGSTQAMGSPSHGHTINDPGHTHSTPAHTHPTGNFAGRIGLVTGGVNGNAGMTSGTTNNSNYVFLHHIIKA